LQEALWSAFLGAGAAVAREWAADVFRTPKEIEQVTGMHCIILPMIKPDQGQTNPFDDSIKPVLLEEFVLECAFFAFHGGTSTNLKAMIKPPQLGDGAKVIGVVSSVPKEGKTTIAANLATLIIASFGRPYAHYRQCVHLRLLTASWAPDAREGIDRSFGRSIRLTALVTKNAALGAWMSCRVLSRLAFPTQLSYRVARDGGTVGCCAQGYDYIVIEIAPVMFGRGREKIGVFIDRSYFVVEWGKPSAVLSWMRF